MLSEFALADESKHVIQAENIVLRLGRHDCVETPSLKMAMKLLQDSVKRYGDYWQTVIESVIKSCGYRGLPTN